MGLDEDIRETLVPDSENILEEHLEDVQDMFQLYEDGTMELLGEYRDLRPETRVLLYLIARRYQYEGGLTEDSSHEVPYSEIYPRFPNRGDSTVRGYFMKLKEQSYAKKGEEGYTLVVERLPDAIDRIEDEVSGS